MLPIDTKIASRKIKTQGTRTDEDRFTVIEAKIAGNFGTSTFYRYTNLQCTPSGLGCQKVIVRTLILQNETPFENM